jgi:hypothetical protein
VERTEHEVAPNPQDSEVFKMNCKGLCRYMNGEFYKEEIGRPHLTCLTCFLRRYHYGKVDKKDFRKTRNAIFWGIHATEKEHQHKIMFVTDTDRPEGFIIPRWQDTYFIMIYNGNKGYAMWHLKNSIIKVLLTIAEFFAQW